MVGVSSQKGGVGKTTVSVNLAAALKLLKNKVLLIDTDTTNPSIGFHLGLERANIGYRDVLYGTAELEDAIAIHAATGLHVLPGTVNTKHFSPSPGNIDKLGMKIKKGNYDFVIFDTAPGFLEEDLSKYYNEALILTTPEMSACTSSLRLAHRYDEIQVKHNLVVNRIRNRRYEISLGEIEEIYGRKIRGAIPEDEVVPISISEHIPAYITSPNSKFSISIKGVARKYASGEYSRPTTAFWRSGGILGFLKRLLHIS
jgi:MinD-like ATPase involved in chromosome partitioning or flagellar assembly